MRQVREQEICYPCVAGFLCVNTASLHKLAAGRKLAATHLNVSNRRMCVCTGFKSGSYNKSTANVRPTDVPTLGQRRSDDGMLSGYLLININ